MNKLLNPEGPLMLKVTRFADYVIVSVLWLIFSLPVITIGASSAALYSVVYNYIRNGYGTLWQTFRAAFRENFRRSTVVWIITLLVQAFIFMDILFFRGMEMRGEPLGKVYWVMLVIFGISMTWAAYLAAYSARFNGSARDVLRFGFILMALHPLRSFCVFAVILCGLLVTIAVPIMIIIVPAAACRICSVTLEKVFLQHMSPEDVEKTLAQTAPVSETDV